MPRHTAILSAESERAHYVAQAVLCGLAGIVVATLGWAAFRGKFSMGQTPGTVVHAEVQQPLPGLGGAGDAAVAAAAAKALESLGGPPQAPASIGQSLGSLPAVPGGLSSSPSMLSPAEPTLMPAGGAVPVGPLGKGIADPQVRDMVEAARAVRRRGDNQAALESLRVADLRERNNPEILSEIAMTCEAMGLGDKAEAAWRSVESLGEAGAGGYYALAKSKLEGREAAPKGAERNPVSIGACQVIPDNSVTRGQRLTLRVPIIAAPGAEIDPAQMDIHVYFYDKVGTDRVEPTKADAPMQSWASAPVDWKDEGREELLDVVYDMPQLRPDEIAQLGKRAFYGYVVKLFYQNRLMGEQAEPRSLLDYKPPGMGSAGATNALFPKN